MYDQSRVWSYGLFFIAWFCCSSLLMGAQGANTTDPVEVEALRAIKRNLIDPYKNLSNWNRGDPCTSNWTGVVCYNTTLDDGYLHVQQLLLLNMSFSGNLSTELSRLSNLTILDFMWNNISGTIPKEIGNIKTLELLLLNGNQLTGPLPEELGYLPKLDRIQIDQNHISGPLPKSFANLNETKHFHMNNNSISGQIPSELSRLPKLVHFLLDNNNLSGSLPSSFSELPNLLILQLDNNNFEGSTIPTTYSNMSKLLKMSLRNCNLTGTIPDLSQIPKLGYLDLSSNQLNGTIPTAKLSDNITTINLSKNQLTGTIPAYFSDLPKLQKLSLSNNSLNGSVPSTIWQNRNLMGLETLTVDLRYNELSNISGSTTVQQNVTVWLLGNPFCLNSNLDQFCVSPSDNKSDSQGSKNSTLGCGNVKCPPSYEVYPNSPPGSPCLCAAPLLVGYRLKSPGFFEFPQYISDFEVYMTTGLNIFLYQLDLYTFAWEEGPRLGMYLKFFPDVNSNDSSKFNTSEVQRIMSMFTGWQIFDSDLFGPYELLNFTLSDVYKNAIPISKNSGLSKGALAGVILGTIAGAVTLSAIVSLLILRRRMRSHHAISKRRRSSKTSIKIDGVKDFTYEEMAMATNNFNNSAQVGQGGYGKVYKGILADGTIVAIKRAQEGSLQGEKEFLTEIELLSRLHHRNLVSLIGYCDEEVEQMLVYEFMSNGTLMDHLSAKTKESLIFDTRLKIALGSAKGILYLHTEADPPVFHRDIKASNILLDHLYTAKVADFGLSRLAPVPDIEGSMPSHISTVVKGTPGYLDPEYFLTRQLTDKSDVYSLGVVFLELLTGMPPISHGKNIIREVNVAYESDKIFSVIDEGMGYYPSECVEKFVTMALKCCKDETDARPSMAEVVRELESIRLMMPESETKTGSYNMITDAAGKVVSDPPSSSSSSTTKNIYVSSDISTSNLVSGAIPTITPR